MFNCKVLWLRVKVARHKKLQNGWFLLGDLLERAKLYGQKPDQWLTEAEDAERELMTKGSKGTNNLWWRKCSVSWFCRWLHTCIYLSALIELHPWKGCILLYVIYISTNLTLKKEDCGLGPSRFPLRKKSMISTGNERCSWEYSCTKLTIIKTDTDTPPKRGTKFSGNSEARETSIQGHQGILYGRGCI